MTFVKPKKQSSILRGILIVLLITVSVGVVRLIVVYSHVVDLEHGIVKIKDGLRETGTSNAELKEKIFTIFSTQNIEEFAAEHGLIQEKKPRYFTTEQQWVFASR